MGQSALPQHCVDVFFRPGKIFAPYTVHLQRVACMFCGRIYSSKTVLPSFESMVFDNVLVYRRAMAGLRALPLGLYGQFSVSSPLSMILWYMWGSIGCR